MKSSLQSGIRQSHSLGHTNKELQCKDHGKPAASEAMPLTSTTSLNIEVHLSPNLPTS